MGEWLTALWRAVARMFGRAPRALAADPMPGSRDFLRVPGDDGDVNDPRADAWIAHLRTALPFPQPAYGAAEAPASERDVAERLSALDAEIAAMVSRAVGTDVIEGEPDWFVAMADRFLPLAAWYAGVGVDGEAPEVPERLRELTERARRIPGINRALERISELVEQLTRQNVGAQAAWFTLLKLHFEALLRPLAKEGESVEVTFDFPAMGARVAELVPLPAPGGATSGTVSRVLCPSVSVRLGEMTLQRGAHVRGR